MSIFGGESFSNWSFLSRKAPGEKVKHRVDFGEKLEGGHSITATTWTPTPDDLTVESVSEDGTVSSAILGGGTDGCFYRLTVEVEVDTGEVWQRYLVLPVGNIYKEPDELTERRAIFMVRQFLRDRPNDNELNFGELQSSWDDLRRALSSALSDWNLTQPPTSHELSGFPTKARRLLYQKGAIEAIRSAAQAEGRNQYQYSDQGFSAQEHSHGPMFMQFAQQLNAEYEQKKQKYKASTNAQSYWGGISIDERYGNGSFGDHLH